LIFQDVAVVPMMLLTPILANRSEGSLGSILYTLTESMLVVGLIIAAAWYAVPKLLEHIVRSRSRELFLLTIIVLCLGIAWLTSLGGLSLALGAFIAGLVISESEYSHQAMADVLPFRDSFNSLFFVSIGILMNWRVLIDHSVLVAGLLRLSPWTFRRARQSWSASRSRRWGSSAFCWRNRVSRAVCCAAIRTKCFYPCRCSR
jgi:CPA2 family monovalent cation:H+ antiporter-2